MLILFFSGLPRWEKTENIQTEEKPIVRASHSLTVASANIFLLMKKEGDSF